MNMLPTYGKKEYCIGGICEIVVDNKREDMDLTKSEVPWERCFHPRHTYNFLCNTSNIQKGNRMTIYKHISFCTTVTDQCFTCQITKDGRKKKKGPYLESLNNLECISL